MLLSEANRLGLSHDDILKPPHLGALRITLFDQLEYVLRVVRCGGFEIVSFVVKIRDGGSIGLRLGAKLADDTLQRLPVI